MQEANPKDWLRRTTLLGFADSIENNRKSNEAKPETQNKFLQTKQVRENL
ncbi:MAG: hypothetical protein LBE36_00635 [Flavobacteriaceae bacterium]|jgi:hypothetical protein|nr:hypothetical protein [Flavobacteriaceae bacterium]